MRTISLANLHKTAKSRPPGYIENVLSLAVEVTETTYALTEEAYESLKVKYRRDAPRPAPPASAPISPVPRDHWRLWARALARLAIPGDRGLGDVMERHAARFGGKTYKRLYRRLLGRECGCARRREEANARYPLRP